MATLTTIRNGRKKAFLAAFGEQCSVTGAARVAKVDRTAHYRWLKDDPEYAAAFLQAQQHAADMLEAEAVRRAVTGWDEPVYQGGALVGHVRKYSTALLIFLLKAARPDRYRERYGVEHSVAPGEGFVQAVSAMVARHLKGAALERFRGDLGGLLERAGRNGHASNGNGQGRLPGGRLSG